MYLLYVIEQHIIKPSSSGRRQPNLSLVSLDLVLEGQRTVSLEKPVQRLVRVDLELRVPPGHHVVEVEGKGPRFHVRLQNGHGVFVLLVDLFHLHPRI